MTTESCAANNLRSVAQSADGLSSSIHEGRWHGMGRKLSTALSAFLSENALNQLFCPHIARCRLGQVRNLQFDFRALPVRSKLLVDELRIISAVLRPQRLGQAK